MVFGFTTIYAISAYHHEQIVSLNPAHHEVLDTTLCDQVVSDLRQVGGFL